nr:TVP38/TMEM64 family protein [bacterium]
MDQVEKSESPDTLQEDAAYIRRRKMVSLFSFAVLIVFFLLVFYFIGRPMIAMLKQPEHFRAWVDDHGMLGWLAMIGMMALQIIVAIIPGEPMELGAGYAFGCLEGAILCLTGALIGSAVVYLFVRRFGIKMVEAFVSREKLHSVKFLNNNKKLGLLVFIIFFIPGTPKDVITYFIGLTPMKLSTFLLISTIGRIPSVLTSTIAGNALGTMEYKMAIIVFSVTAVISALGIWLYRVLTRHQDKKMQQEQAVENEGQAACRQAAMCDGEPPSAADGAGAMDMQPEGKMALQEEAPQQVPLELHGRTGARRPILPASPKADKKQA